MCSEVEVIHVWLTELLRTVENADDVLVKNFSFGPLEKRLKTGDYLRGETIRESLVRIPRLTEIQERCAGGAEAGGGGARGGRQPQATLTHPQGT